MLSDTVLDEIRTDLNNRFSNRGYFQKDESTITQLVSTIEELKVALEEANKAGFAMECQVNDARAEVERLNGENEFNKAMLDFNLMGKAGEVYRAQAASYKEALEQIAALSPWGDPDNALDKVMEVARQALAGQDGQA